LPFFRAFFSFCFCASTVFISSPSCPFFTTALSPTAPAPSEIGAWPNGEIYKNLLLDPSGILPEYQPKTVIGLTKKGCI
jgi:hypothetical protein